MSRRAKVDWTQEDYNIMHSVPMRGRENELETQNPRQESHRTQQGHRDRKRWTEAYTLPGGPGEGFIFALNLEVEEAEFHVKIWGILDKE